MKGAPARPLAERFWENVGKPDERGCRPWLRYVNPRNGYGQVSLAKADAEWFGSRIATAPVVACTLAHGSRPDGMQVLHSCDVRLCCEPSHLRWGTQAENNAEAWGRHRQASGQHHHHAALSDGDVRQLLAEAITGTPVVDVAAEFGIDWSHVYGWLRGEGRGGRLLPQARQMVLAEVAP